MDNNDGKDNDGVDMYGLRKVSRLKVQEVEHWPLEKPWVLWHTNVSDGFSDVGDGYKKVIEVRTIHQFWALYAFIDRPQQLPVNSGYFFFKKGFPEECNSGEYGRIIYNGSTSPEKQSKVNEYWQRAMIAVAGEQFGNFSPNICGVSITVKKGSHFQLTTWVDSVLDASKCVKHHLKELLRLSQDANFEVEMMENSAEMNDSPAWSNAPEEKETEVWSNESIGWLHREKTFVKMPFSKPPLSFSSVLVVTGFDPKKLNCQKLYNLFSSYGKCVKVFFFLRASQSVCYVEMASVSDAICVIQHLSGYVLDEDDLCLKIRLSKVVTVYEPRNPFNMPDNSPSFKDFSNVSDQEIKSEFEPAGKEYPSDRLYFYNAPVCLKNTTIWQLLDGFKIRPKSVVISNFGKDTSAGFIIFKSRRDAVKALMLVSNFKIINPVDQKKYVFKLCFG